MLFAIWIYRHIISHKFSVFFNKTITYPENLIFYQAKKLIFRSVPGRKLKKGNGKSLNALLRGPRVTEKSGVPAYNPDLTAEQRQLAKIVHDYASQFLPTENGDAQLLQGCYDYMEAFKRVMDSTSKVQMDYICLQYPGYFRFAKWMERLAQGIADGVIEVPKDH